MKTFKSLFGMAVLALMAASCSNDMNDVQAPEQIAKDGNIHFTATLAPKTFDATTRALTESGGTLLSKWEKDEEIEIRYKITGGTYEGKATVTKVDEETGAATIEADLSNATDGTSVEFFYPYSLRGKKTNPIAEQNGELSSKLDIRKGTGTINIIDGEATLASSLKLDAQYAIMYLELHDVNSQDNNLYIHKLNIFNGDDKLVTVTPENKWPSYVYVALPALNNANINFWAIEGIGGEPLEPPYNTYLARGTASLEVGKYYKTEVRFATIGTVIGGNGLYYEDAQMAEKAGTTAEAVIAWMQNSSIDNNSPVFAVALRDTENKMNWENAIAGVETWSANHKVPGAQGEWALPSASEWMLLFNGGFETLPDASGAEFVEYPFGTFRELLSNAGGDVQEDFYWTSSKVEGDSANRWAYYFKQPGVKGSGFYNYAGMSANYVRYALEY